MKLQVGDQVEVSYDGLVGFITDTMDLRTSTAMLEAAFRSSRIGRIAKFDKEDPGYVHVDFGGGRLYDFHRAEIHRVKG
jgi:hypothetical protein